MHMIIIMILRPLYVADTASGFANFDAFASDRMPGPGPTSASAGASSMGGPVTVSGAPPPVSADKYSALAELESAFSLPTATTTATVNWDSSWANRNAQPSWSAPTTGSAFGSAGPAPAGLMYGGNVAPSAAPAAGFTASAGFTLLSCHHHHHCDCHYLLNVHYLDIPAMFII